MKPEEMVGKKIKLIFNAIEGNIELTVCAYCGIDDDLDGKVFICFNDGHWYTSLCVKIVITEEWQDDPNYAYSNWFWA